MTAGEDAQMSRILLVDDNTSVREAISIILEDESDLTISGEANDVGEAKAKCDSLQPDLALIDLSLQGEDGLELVRYLATHAPAIRTVILSLHDEHLYIDAARDAGARGYIIKTEDPDAIVDRLRAVLNGREGFP